MPLKLPTAACEELCDSILCGRESGKSASQASDSSLLGTLRQLLMWERMGGKCLSSFRQQLVRNSATDSNTGEQGREVCLSSFLQQLVRNSATASNTGEKGREVCLSSFRFVRILHY